MTPDLFESLGHPGPAAEPLAPGAMLLRAFALPEAAALLGEVERIARQAPFRHLTTPGGSRMSVAMTNCGTLGWVSDRQGYRYTGTDPASGLPWPPMPESFLQLAAAAATRAGFTAFVPNACLINRYTPGARLSLHQDRDERDLTAPIVSVSLGLPAVFLFGGLQRTERCARIPLLHGDVVIWGGPARLRYHGILPIRAGEHSLTGRCRINLTFRGAA